MQMAQGWPTANAADGPAIAQSCSKSTALLLRGNAGGTGWLAAKHCRRLCDGLELLRSGATIIIELT
jgi:hypothetical protein